MVALKVAQLVEHLVDEMAVRRGNLLEEKMVGWKVSKTADSEADDLAATRAEMYSKMVDSWVARKAVMKDELMAATTEV